MHIYVGNETYSSFLGCEGNEDGDVYCFNEATKAIDGDEKEDIFLLSSVVEPKHRAEERHHVGNRLKSFCGFLLTNPVERWPASTSILNQYVSLNLKFLIWLSYDHHSSS